MGSTISSLGLSDFDISDKQIEMNPERKLYENSQNGHLHPS